MGTFTLALAKFADKVKDRGDAVTGDVVAQVSQALDRRSPVGDATYWKSPPPKGYIGGRFRGSWQLGVDESPSADVYTIDPSGSATQGRILASIPEQASGKVYYIINNAPYGEEIERGHSRQAPSGLAGLTAIEFPQMVERAVIANGGGA